MGLVEALLTVVAAVGIALFGVILKLSSNVSRLGAALDDHEGRLDRLERQTDQGPPRWWPGPVGPSIP